MTARERKIAGWGYEGERADEATVARAISSLEAFFGSAPAPREPVAPTSSTVRAPRVAAPESLAELARSSIEERALHAVGRSYRDLSRAMRGRFNHPPDVVFYPSTEEDVARVLDWAAGARVAVVPYGGGTSVAGGVEPDVGPRFTGAATLDLSRLSGVVALDEMDLTATFLAGTLGPDLEAALRPRGLTLRHFPQSFELSTLGGWIATRAGGHFATGPTHIDDLVEALRVVTPSGVLATRPLPGSGAGPSPERALIGSEGILGVITSATVRIFRRPTMRASATVRFEDFDRGLDALRAITQSGLQPANLRLIDGPEALLSGAGFGDSSLMLVAFESDGAPLDPLLVHAVELARQHGGTCDDSQLKLSGGRARDGAAETYKAAFFRAPYLRDELIRRDVFVETYETAATFSRVVELDAAVRRAVASLKLGPHLFARRITHAYRDGCAPYYTLITPLGDRDEVSFFDDVKAAITSAVVAAGGTSTHHHAVGRDVVPFYRSERPELFARMLGAAKAAVDPAGIMNPGVLLPAPA